MKLSKYKKTKTLRLLNDVMFELAKNGNEDALMLIDRVGKFEKEIRESGVRKKKKLVRKR
jgi:hypothetical protein